MDDGTSAKVAAARRHGERLAVLLAMAMFVLVVDISLIDVPISTKGEGMAFG